jgi:hypothetical protein
VLTEQLGKCGELLLDTLKSLAYSSGSSLRLFDGDLENRPSVTIGGGAVGHYLLCAGGHDLLVAGPHPRDLCLRGFTPLGIVSIDFPLS